MEDYHELQDELLSILNEDETDENNFEEEDLDEDVRRENILKIQDVNEIGGEEYLVFLDYSIANIQTILRKEIRTKIPEKNSIIEMAKDAISLAIATYDLDIAKKAKASFRTHLGWKNKQVVTDYARAVKKASNNEFNSGDDEFANSIEENKLQSDMEGNSDFENNVDMIESHVTSKYDYEYNKKIEWAMRQVRHELPRENNLILDVGIGEILRSNGSPYSLAEWARFTNQNIKHLRSLFTSSKRLVKQKLHRKGYMDIVTDEEKTSEDFLKDKNIHSQIKEFEKDESIIELTAC